MCRGRNIPLLSAGRRRGSDGVTTIEWLLIVSAVAAAAAVAVVVVQNMVEDTSDQIDGADPLRAAAQAAAAEVVIEAETADAVNDPRFDPGDEWEAYFTDKCNGIAIAYGNAGITVIPQFTDLDGDGYDASRDTATCEVA